MQETCLLGTQYEVLTRVLQGHQPSLSNTTPTTTTRTTHTHTHTHIPCCRRQG
jgi:hypothetical protein